MLFLKNFSILSLAMILIKRILIKELCRIIHRFRLILTGSKRSLTNRDVWSLQGEHTTESINQKFQQRWNEERQKAEENECDPLITKAFIKIYRRKFLLSCILKLFADGFLLVTPYILG